MARKPAVAVSHDGHDYGARKRGDAVTLYALELDLSGKGLIWRVRGRARWSDAYGMYAVSVNWPHAAILALDRALHML